MTPFAKFQNDFNALTDEQIASESEDCLNRMADDEEWLEAVALWKAAGKPRS